MAEKGCIVEVRWHHERIMDFLISRPDASLKDLSIVTGYSTSWLSRLINTDIFRKRLKERAGEVDVLLVSEVSSKLNALADHAIERMHDVLSTVNDPEVLVDAFDKVMKSNGYAPNRAVPGSGVTFVNNVVMADRELLAKARARLGQAIPPQQVLPTPQRAPGLQIAEGEDEEIVEVPQHGCANTS